VSHGNTVNSVFSCDYCSTCASRPLRWPLGWRWFLGTISGQLMKRNFGAKTICEVRLDQGTGVQYRRSRTGDRYNEVLVAK